jgi:hypothetical protein
MNSFDKTYAMGNFSTDLYDIGYGPVWRHDEYHSTRTALRKPSDADRKNTSYHTDPYGQPSTSRRHYTDTLRAFFATRLENASEADKWHLESLMQGQTTRDAAKELDVSQPAIVQARKRAIRHLVAGISPEGSLSAVAGELVFFFMSEGGVSLAGRLPDRVLAESTKWSGDQ